MSNPDFERYKEQYTKFISIVVEYHNSHQNFNRKITLSSTQDLKKVIREMRSLTKEMVSTVWDSYLVNKKGLEEARKHKREVSEQRKKLKPPSQKGKRKNG